MIKLTVSNSSKVPVYMQLYEQIRLQIINGDLKGGERLPSIRNVAARLCVSVITTKTAYEMLAKEGLISSLQGKGFFVNGIADPRLERNKIAEKRLRHDLEFYKKLGLSVSEFVDLVEKEY